MAAKKPKPNDLIVLLTQTEKTRQAIPDFSMLDLSHIVNLLGAGLEFPVVRAWLGAEGRRDTQKYLSILKKSALELRSADSKAQSAARNVAWAIHMMGTTQLGRAAAHQRDLFAAKNRRSSASKKAQEASARKRHESMEGWQREALRIAKNLRLDRKIEGQYRSTQSIANELADFRLGDDPTPLVNRSPKIIATFLKSCEEAGCMPLRETRSPARNKRGSKSTIVRSPE